jgi:hypothetical protein
MNLKIMSRSNILNFCLAFMGIITFVGLMLYSDAKIKEEDMDFIFNLISISVTLAGFIFLADVVKWNDYLDEIKSRLTSIILLSLAASLSFLSFLGYHYTYIESSFIALAIGNLFLTSGLVLLILEVWNVAEVLNEKKGQSQIQKQRK